MKQLPTRYHVILLGYLLCLCIWTIFSLTILATLYQSGLLFAAPSRDASSCNISDFVNHYNMGRMAVSEDRYKVYDPNVQLAWTKKVINPLRMEKPFYIQLIPWSFLLMVPFGLVSLKAAFLLWTILGILASIASTVLLLRELRNDLGPWHIILLILVTSAAFPTWFTISQGQTTCLLSGFMCCYFWALVSKYDTIGGISLACTVLKPQYAIFFAVPAIAKRRWKLLGIALLTEVILFVASGLCLGWHNIMNYPLILTSAETTSVYCGVNPQLMVCLRALFSIFLPNQSKLVFLISLFFLVLAMLFLLRFWQLENQKAIATNWALAVTIVTSLVFSPHTHLHDCFLLAIAAFLTLPNTISPDFKLSAQTLWNTIFVLYPPASWYFYLSLNSSEAPRWFFILVNLLILILGIVITMRSRHLASLEGLR